MTYAEKGTPACGWCGFGVADGFGHDWACPYVWWANREDNGKVRFPTRGEGYDIEILIDDNGALPASQSFF